MARFHEIIRELREQSGLSGYRLARLANVNSAYVYRMERPGGPVPRRVLLDSIIRTLELSPFDTERVLVAAGYCPQAIQRIGSWDESLDIVSQVLNDETLSGDEREEFRQIIRAVASRWIATET